MKNTYENHLRQAYTDYNDGKAKNYGIIALGYNTDDLTFGDNYDLAVKYYRENWEKLCERFDNTNFYITDLNNDESSLREPDVYRTIDGKKERVN